MPLENEFGALALDTTTAAVRDRLPSAGAASQATLAAVLATLTAPYLATGAATEATLAAIKARLPAALGGDGGLITHVQNEIDIADRSGRVVGHVTIDNASLTTDVADRVGRLLGHVQVDNFPASQTVAGTVALDATTLAALEHISIDNLPSVQPINDNGGSLTIDAPVGTPVAVRLSDGGAFFDPRDVSDRLARVLGHVIVDSSALPAGAATEATLAGVALDVSIGTDGAAAPAISGTGVRGWLRGIYEKVSGTLAVSASSLPLPTGAATESTLSGVKTGTDRIPASPATDRATAAAPAAARLSDGSAFYKPTTPTDTQPVSAASLPLPSGAATDRATAAAPGAARLSDGTSFYKSTTPSDTQPVSAASLPLPAGAATDSTLSAVSSAAGATTDVEASGNGSLVAIQKRIRTLLNGGLPAALSSNGGLKVEQVVAGPTQPVSGTVTVSNPTTNPETGLAKDSTLTTSIGAQADAEATGNGSSIGILKRLRTLLAGGLPAALVGGRLDVNVGNTPTVTANAGSGTQAVSMATQTPDTIDRATREVGRVRLWDGADEATVIPVRTPITSTDKGIGIMDLPPLLPTYQVAFIELAALATTTGVKELVTLFKPAATAVDYFLVELIVYNAVAVTAGRVNFELQHISAEGGTPGGTASTPEPLHDRTAAASAMLARAQVTGAPTTAGQIFLRKSFAGVGEYPIFRASTLEEAILFKASQADGLRLSANVLSALTGAPILTVYARWIEL